MSHMQTEQLTDRRIFSAPPSLLFRAWTDPELIARWWGPTGTATLDADLRVGGAYRLAMLLPNGETLATVGTYTAVTEPQRLAFTFAWEGGEEPETHVAVELHDLGGTTELVLSHTGFPSAAERENHSLGWRDNLDRYGALVQELARPVPKISVITINVPDMAQAIAFYSDTLGFPIESREWYPEIVQLQHAGAALILYKVARAAEVDYPNVAQTVLGIATPNLAASLAQLRAQGVRVLHDEPQPFPAGIYAAIRDPFGNVLELLEFQR